MTTATRRVTTPAAPTSDWRDDAACRYVDPDLFHPTGHTKGWIHQMNQAKTVCAGCPVRQACLQWALDTGPVPGVWGGTSENERKAMPQRRETALGRCLARQGWIEKRLAMGMTQSMLARLLGVETNVVSKAVRHFRAEQERSAGEGR